MARTQSFTPKFRKIAVSLTKQMPVPEVARILNMGTSTLYTWKKNAELGKKNLAVKPETLRELNLLRNENRELKARLAHITALANLTKE